MAEGQDYGGAVRIPIEDLETQKELQVPDDFAGWAISLIYDFEERFCKDLRTRAARSFDYYNSKQWPEDVKVKLEGDDRPMMTFNEIRPKIDAIIGEERRNREDWVARPREGSDDAESEVRTALLKYIRELNALQADESRVFEEELIGGFGGIVASIIQTEDGPQIRLEYRRWSELRWDWNFRSKDMSDAQWAALSLMVSVERLQELFPDFDDSISGEYLSMRNDPEEVQVVDKGESVGVSRYKDGTMRPTLYDGKDRRIRATEFYHRTIRVRKMVALLSPTGVIEREMLEGDEALASQVDQLVAAGKAMVRTVREPAIKGSLIVGRRTLAQWWSPFRGGNAFGQPYFPIFLCFASDTNGHVMGIVEPMTAPQDEINKRWSMTVENYLKQARSGGVYEDGAFEDESRAIKMWGGAGKWVKAKVGAIVGSKFKAHTPPPTDQALMTLFEFAERTMERVSNIVPARMGLASPEASGVALRTRALQSALVQVKAFDNFRHMQLLIGRFINANLPMLFPVKRTLRLTLASGQSKSITVNDTMRTVEGATRIVNSTRGDLFDIVMDMTPANATFRELQAQNLANLLGQIGPLMKEIPNFLPAYMMMLEGLMRMLDGLPNRERIIQVMEQSIEQLVAPALPGMPPGMPPGLPPGAAPPMNIGGVRMPFVPAVLQEPGGPSGPGALPRIP